MFKITSVFCIISIAIHAQKRELQFLTSFGLPKSHFLQQPLPLNSYYVNNDTYSLDAFFVNNNSVEAKFNQRIIRKWNVHLGLGLRYANSLAIHKIFNIMNLEQDLGFVNINFRRFELFTGISKEFKLAKNNIRINVGANLYYKMPIKKQIVYESTIRDSYIDSIKYDYQIPVFFISEKPAVIEKQRNINLEYFIDLQFKLHKSMFLKLSLSYLMNVYFFYGANFKNYIYQNGNLMQVNSYVDNSDYTSSAAQTNFLNFGIGLVYKF